MQLQYQGKQLILETSIQEREKKTKKIVAMKSKNQQQSQKWRVSTHLQNLRRLNG